MINPNFYFNNFLIRDREPIIFACLPFIKKCTERLENIIKPAVESLGLTLENSSDEKSGKEITERIYEGINASRILLFDLSMDDRHGDKVNPNVAYELGIARSIRSDNDILLITDAQDIEKEIFFDIRGMNISKVDSNFNKERFCQILDLILKKQEYYEDKRIEAISRLVDGEGIKLMFDIGRRPDDYNHFNTRYMPAENKLSALRLLDLGIVKTEWHCYAKGYEYAYHWTSLGRAVMKYMNMTKITLEDFKKMPEYKEALAFNQEYHNFKNIVGK